MEGPLLFSDWRNQFCESGYIANSSLQSQCNSCQSLSIILQRWRNNLSNLLEDQKILDSQTLNKIYTAGVTTKADFKLHYTVTI